MIDNCSTVVLDDGYVCSTFVLICITCLAITVGTVILRAFDRVRLFLVRGRHGCSVVHFGCFYGCLQIEQRQICPAPLKKLHPCTRRGNDLFPYNKSFDKFILSGSAAYRAPRPASIRRRPRPRSRPAAPCPPPPPPPLLPPPPRFCLPIRDHNIDSSSVVQLVRNRFRARTRSAGAGGWVGAMIRPRRAVSMVALAAILLGPANGLPQGKQSAHLFFCIAKPCKMCVRVARPRVHGRRH